MDNPNLRNPHLNGEPFFWQAGPVGVLLLHGFTATPVEVRAAADKLSSLGYSVAGPLLPGHATHPADLNRVKWRDWVDAAELAYRDLRANCARVFIGGESMGAVVALYLATEHPEAAGVLAFSPAMRIRLSRFKQLQVRALAPFIEAVPKGDLDVEDQWQGYPVNPLKGVVQLLELQRALLARLHLIRQPLLVVQGRLDTTIDPQVGEMILAGVSSNIKELRWFERSSHVVLLDQELDSVIEVVAQFMDRAVLG
jgi:carboxylesterase